MNTLKQLFDKIFGPRRVLIGFKVTAHYPKRGTYEYLAHYPTDDIEEAFAAGEDFVMRRYRQDGDDSVLSFWLRAEPVYEKPN